SLNVRAAARLLARAIAATDVEAYAKADAIEAPALTVSVAAGIFELGDARLDLSRKGALRRIAMRLVDQHRVARAVALTPDELLAAGWPEERLRVDVGQRRLHTAIWTLRKRCFGARLLRRDDGY